MPDHRTGQTINVVLKDNLRDRAHNAVAYVGARRGFTSTAQLVRHLLAQEIAEWERADNNGQPFPSPAPHPGQK